MQYIRSKIFDLFLVLWTVTLGLATPILMVINRQNLVRAYSIFWANGIACGIWKIIGLRYEIEGTLPHGAGPRLIVSNHQSMWETILFATLMPNVTFVAKKELAKVPIFGWYMKKFPMVLIDRSSGKSALNDLLEKGAKAVAEGRSVLIFPEGTRIQPDEDKKFHFGVAALYAHLKIPAVTIAHNSGCFWNDEYSMKYKGKITIRVIEEIQPGLKATDFLTRVETSINENKHQLVERLDIDNWRWAVG